MLICQFGENREINAVFSKALRVLGHAELFEPVRHLPLNRLGRVTAGKPGEASRAERPRTEGRTARPRGKPALPERPRKGVPGNWPRMK